MTKQNTVLIQLALVSAIVLGAFTFSSFTQDVDSAMKSMMLAMRPSWIILL